ncbi:hypothetical protein DB30_07252 [Enhygromyxa salina]|uniref:Uncharacterized protein n=2 Tax=Enhygromyxa salina TaxID=215803 RepID=A0A0C2CWR2_9BACT|nr:hypothetical protein DB30_07252 [Enhygromyxa salina]
MTCDPDETCESCPGDCGPCDEPVITECNDGIDNDGDGLVDWQFDVGCWSDADTTEASAPRDQENGFTTFDPGPDSLLIYVSSSEGDDANDGLTPQTAVATPAQGAKLVRDGFHDFLLFKRGDSWRGMDIGANSVERRFKSGPSPDQPLVIYSYGDSRERPRLEIDKAFVDDDGNQRSNLAIVGLALISYPKIPGDPEFNGADGGALRFVGTGQNILIEDNYVEYGEFIVQNVSEVEVRHNVVYRSYHVGTCLDGNPNGDPTYRPSGIFAGGVNGLLIESNVFDENGWNPDVPDACATIYNHDMYLSGNHNLTVRDNLILRASSIGIKLSSGGLAGSSQILIEDNVFAEGEIGVSMGGNANTEHRFTDAVIRDNVFTDIGRSQPTGRTLTWYIDIIDNDGSEIRDNLLVNQPDLGNAYGIHLSGGSNREVVVADNAMFGLKRRAIFVDAQNSWSSISFTSNRVVGDADQSCLVDHEGGFAAFDYGSNEYFSPASPSAWFCIDGANHNINEWAASSGEVDASEINVNVENRNLDDYAGSLGFESTLAGFAEQARMQSRHTHRSELTAAEAGNYIRDGYL